MNPQSEIDRIFAESTERLMKPSKLTKAIEAYQNVQALHQHCTIRVERIEVTIGLEGGDTRDSYFDRTGYLTDDQTQRAYDILLDDADICAKLDAIAVKLAKGEIA